MAKWMLVVLMQCGRSDERPSVIVQYGEPRTATTLQFEALCGASCALYGAGLTECLYCDKVEAKKFRKTTVCKVHNLTKAEELLRANGGGWLFGTARSEDAARGNEYEKKRLMQHLEARVHGAAKVMDIQIFESLGLRGYYVVRDLERIMGLTTVQMDQVAEYLRYWTILRRCCGAQLSNDYRFRLQNRTGHRLRSSPAYDACETYDINEVEQHLRATKLFSDCGSLDAIERLSVVDGRFNGDYCRRANNLTTALQLQFNDPRYLQLLDPDVRIDPVTYNRIYPKPSVRRPPHPHSPWRFLWPPSRWAILWSSSVEHIIASRFFKFIGDDWNNTSTHRHQFGSSSLIPRRRPENVLYSVILGLIATFAVAVTVLIVCHRPRAPRLDHHRLRRGSWRRRSRRSTRPASKHSAPSQSGSSSHKDV